MSLVADLQLVDQSVVAFGLALTRVSSFVIAAPFFGQGTVPNTVKLGVCMALSVFWMPQYLEHVPADFQPSIGNFGFAILMEFIVGISLGWLTRMIMLPARVAGSYLGQELGFNLGQVVDPSTGSATNETGLLFDAMALVVFWVTDTHHMALRMLGLSVEVLRGDREFVYHLAPSATDLFSRAHELGILMIAPLASILFISLVSLAVLMRAWSHVTLFSFGMGARLLVGLGAFFLLTPLIVSNMAHIFQAVAQAMGDTMFVLD